MRQRLAHIFMVSAAVVPLAVGVAGCGGDSEEPQPLTATLITEDRSVTVETGTPEGVEANLAAINLERKFEPENAQALVTRWRPRDSERGTQPPPRFTVHLTRFQDADSGQPARSVGVPLEPVSYESPIPAGSPESLPALKGWDFRKSGNDGTLLFEPGGVYTLEARSMTGTLTEVLQGGVFIAPGLSRESTGNDANGVTVETNRIGRENGVEYLGVLPSNRASVRRDQGVMITSSLDPEKTPPKSWTVFLRRYREARGDRPFSETSQPITVEETEPGKWRVRRQSNEPLDPYAVYIVEIRRTGASGRIRRVFITGE